MLVHSDPIPGGGISVNFVSKEAAIRCMNQLAADRNKPYSSDAAALVDFVVVNWAEDLESVVEKMAKAMWDRFHQGSGGEAAAVAWEQALRDPWREQAKAALKALGVTVP